MSVVVPEEYRGDTPIRQLVRGAFGRGADAELERVIEIIRQYEERGELTAEFLIARLREGRE